MDIVPKKNEMGVLEWEVKMDAQKELFIKYSFEATADSSAQLAKD
jgi:hypothetical protein